MPNVYAPNALATKLGVPANVRVMFYDGKALLYKDATLVHPHVNPTQAKQLFKQVKEQAPDRLNAFGKAARMIVEDNLALPVAVFQF
jgi:hypothetical protein